MSKDRSLNIIHSRASEQPSGGGQADGCGGGGRALEKMKNEKRLYVSGQQIQSRWNLLANFIIIKKTKSSPDVSHDREKKKNRKEKKIFFFALFWHFWLSSKDEKGRISVSFLNSPIEKERKEKKKKKKGESQTKKKKKKNKKTPSLPTPFPFGIKQPG